MTGKPRQQILVLCQLYLQLAFMGMGMPGENIEDKRHPVDYLNLEGSLQTLLLHRRKLVVEYGHVIACFSPEGYKLFQLALAEIIILCRRVQPLGKPTDNPGAGGGGQAGQFIQGVICGPFI